MSDKLRKELADVLAKAKDVTDKADSENRVVTTEEKAQIDGHMKKAKAIRARIDEVEDEKALREEIDALGKGFVPNGEKAEEKAEAKSVGQALVESEQFKAVMEHGLSGNWSTGMIEFPAKATLTTATGGALIQPSVQPGVLPTLFQPLTIADLMAPGSTDSNTVRYLRESVATNAAAAVAEGAAKPESALEFAAVDEPVRKIATLLPVVDEMLEDYSQLRSYVDGRLALFVRIAEEAQLLNGSGVAPNLAGLRGRIPGGNVAAIGTDTLPDAIFKAMTRVRNSFLEPEGIITTPTVWEKARLLKDANSQYYGGGPFTGAYGSGGIAPNNLWGLPVVVTTACPAGEVIVGAFRSASQVFRKGGLTVEASNSHASFFAENKTAIRAEERLALAVFRPSAFAVVTGA